MTLSWTTRPSVCVCLYDRHFCTVLKLFALLSLTKRQAPLRQAPCLICNLSTKHNIWHIVGAQFIWNERIWNNEWVNAKKSNSDIKSDTFIHTTKQSCKFQDWGEHLGSRANIGVWRGRHFGKREWSGHLAITGNQASSETEERAIANPHCSLVP